MKHVGGFSGGDQCDATSGWIVVGFAENIQRKKQGSKTQQVRKMLNCLDAEEDDLEPHWNTKVPGLRCLLLN